MLRAPSGVFQYYAPRMSFALCFVMVMFICKRQCVCVRARVHARVMLPVSNVRKQIMSQISVHHRDEITSDCRKCHNDDVLNLYCTRNGVETSKRIEM
jgi:hypothetical protein